MIVSRRLTAAGLPPAAGLRLLHWLHGAGADEFTITVLALEDEAAPVADAFEDALAPYALPMACRRVLVHADAPGSTREVRRWSLSEPSLAALLPFVARGLFHAAPDPAGWFEDLAVYRDGDLVLGIVSHEQEGTLRLTVPEHDAVRALGVSSAASEEWSGY